LSGANTLTYYEKFVNYERKMFLTLGPGIERYSDSFS
jgi:hypothetical protein